MSELNDIRKRALAAEEAQSFEVAAELWRDLALHGERSPGELKSACNFTAYDAWLRNGGALYQGDRLAEAVAVWERLHAEFPTQQVRRALTRAYLDLNDFGKGRLMGEAFLKQDREDPEVWKNMGRIYACLAEQAEGRGEDAMPHWQSAIDALNEVLIAFNPEDEVAIEWKARCVEGVAGHFMPEVERRLEEFLRLVRREKLDEARRVLYEILPRVVEHVADLQGRDPIRSKRVAQEFLQLLRREARKVELDLETVFAYVVVQLRILIMWACHAVDDQAGADDALREAKRFGQNRTLPHVAQAQLQFARGQTGGVEAPLEMARAAVANEYDKYLMAQAYYALGQFSETLEWAENVDLDKFRDQVYRPDRSIAAFRRFLAEVRELVESSDDLAWEELSPNTIQLIIRRLLGDAAIE